MSKTDKTASGGLSLLGVLQVIFIVLKLCKLVDWSWKIVLTPLWINIGVIAVLVITVIIATLVERR